LRWPRFTALTIRLTEHAGLSAIFFGGLYDRRVSSCEALRLVWQHLLVLVNVSARLVGVGLLTVLPLLIVTGGFAAGLLPRLARACLVTGADTARPQCCDSQHHNANDLRKEIAQMVKLSKWWKTAERARTGLVLGPVITGIARNSEAYAISRPTPNRPR
jgi:hypothetical protein